MANPYDYRAPFGSTEGRGTQGGERTPASTRTAVGMTQYGAAPQPLPGVPGYNPPMANAYGSFNPFGNEGTGRSGGGQPAGRAGEGGGGQQTITGYQSDAQGLPDFGKPMYGAQFAPQMADWQGQSGINTNVPPGYTPEYQSSVLEYGWTPQMQERAAKGLGVQNPALAVKDARAQSYQTQYDPNTFTATVGTNWDPAAMNQPRAYNEMNPYQETLNPQSAEYWTQQFGGDPWQGFQSYAAQAPQGQGMSGALLATQLAKQLGMDPYTARMSYIQGQQDFLKSDQAAENWYNLSRWGESRDRDVNEVFAGISPFVNVTNPDGSEDPSTGHYAAPEFFWSQDQYYEGEALSRNIEGMRGMVKATGNHPNAVKALQDYETQVRRYMFGQSGKEDQAFTSMLFSLASIAVMPALGFTGGLTPWGIGMSVGGALAPEYKNLFGLGKLAGGMVGGR